MKTDAQLLQEWEEFFRSELMLESDDDREEWPKLAKQRMWRMYNAGIERAAHLLKERADHYEPCNCQEKYYCTLINEVLEDTSYDVLELRKKYE